VHPADRAAVLPDCADARPFLPGAYHIGAVPVDVLHMPGHTPGQLNLWLPTERTLLAGDNVLGDTTSVVVPPAGDLHAYRATLERLAALNPAFDVTPAGLVSGFITDRGVLLPPYGASLARAFGWT
jgi:glyoxylase-like metal-dependent hydrolase (beta-lactamase superfamily II)